MKPEVNKHASNVLAHLGQRVVADEPNRVVAYRIESDAVEILQRLYYFSKRIAKSVLASSQLEDPSYENEEEAS
jgi:phosphate:Na+ symporter